MQSQLTGDRFGASTYESQLLSALQECSSLAEKHNRDLVPFFSSASISSYESVYHSAGVIDWPAVERGLLEDLFEGR